MLPLLHYALRSGGFLMLGRSESLGAAADLFTVVDKRNKIFRRNDIVSQLPATLAAPFPSAARAAAPPVAVVAGTAYQDPLDSATRVLLAEFTPPAVVVDASLEIVLFCGDSEPYLQHAAGRATLNLLAMAREGLAAPLRSLIERVRHEGRALTQEGVTLGGAQEGRRLDISAVPLAGPPQDAHLLLVFAPSAPLPEALGETTPAGRDERRESARLKRELVSTQEYLQSLLAQKDKGNEELRAANEEIQSANEELQSVNEELETTKEELQSTNEELRTINEELESRNGQLAARKRRSFQPAAFHERAHGGRRPKSRYPPLHARHRGRTCRDRKRRGAADR